MDTDGDRGWERTDPMASAALRKVTFSARAPSVTSMPRPQGGEEALGHISPSLPFLPSLLSPDHFVAKKEDEEFIPNKH